MRLLYWILAGLYSQEYQVLRVMVRQSQVREEMKDKVGSANKSWLLDLMSVHHVLLEGH